jgi:hypothetical protein
VTLESDILHYAPSPILIWRAAPSDQIGEFVCPRCASREIVGAGDRADEYGKCIACKWFGLLATAYRPLIVNICADLGSQKYVLPDYLL